MNEVPISGAGEGRRWPMRLAVLFVLITLLSLVMVPWLVQRRVMALRSQIEASEPARTLVMQWQFDLVRQMSALSELLLAGDSARLASYTAVWDQERATHRHLAALAARMGPEVVQRFATARELADAWHSHIDEDELRRQRAEGVRLVEIPRERRLFNEVLAAVAAVDEAIVRETESTRADIMAAERGGLRVTLVLGVLALLSGMAVLGLQSRVRRFAAEAEHRRQEASEALAESARAAEARNRLLRGITHDVKNPLGTAQGYAQLLAMGIKAPLAPEQAPLVEGIERSIDNALAMIADLLDLARMDSGGVSVERVDVDLNDIAAEAVQDHRASADMAGHTLKADVGNEPVMTHTDPVRVRQVVDNLITNALKYTPAPGRIVVSAESFAGESPLGPGTWATIAVADTGPGIPAGERDAIFDEFTRLDESGAKGHGLGLAIARGLSRQLGGDLTIADSQDGATFVLWIPQREKQAPP